MLNVLVAGDTHGDAKNIQHLLLKAKGNKCSKVLVTGDFGHFPHLKNGVKWYNNISAKAVKEGIELHWIKGNHDNHDDLKKYIGCVEIYPNVFFHQNLHVWTWGNSTFCAVGGAYSIDKADREEGIDWWKDEQISYKEVERSEDIMSEIDIIISHDCPISVDIDKYLEYKRDIYTQGNRQKLQDIVDNLKPKMVIHGHYHQRIESKGTHPDGEFRNIGLGANVTSRASQSMILKCED
jgi:Icc-related predicted phosphoesterase